MKAGRAAGALGRAPAGLAVHAGASGQARAGVSGGEGARGRAGAWRGGGALLGAALALAGLACGSVEARSVAFRPLAPPTSRAELYLGSVPARPYAELGLVQAVGTGAGADEAAVLAALRERAQRMGCEAVVRVHVALGQTAAHAMGVCARWAGPEAAPGEAPVAEGRGRR